VNEDEQLGFEAFIAGLCDADLITTLGQSGIDARSRLRVGRAS